MTAPSLRAAPEDHVDAVIVGAGFAGLYMLYRLRQLGLTVRVFEAGDGVGGTWYWNRYPGARCDVESMYYSYSFSSALEQQWEWSERYAGQQEILRYIEHLADRFDLLRDICLGERVVAAHFESQDSTWRVHTGNGRSVTAHYCIMATGCLSVPELPDVPGIGSFRGPAHHTALWPHGGLNLTGLRVGIVGTGSSAVQSIPVIAGSAAEVTVFQRTPAYSLPAHNRALTDSERAALKARYRVVRQQQRESGFGVPGAFPPAVRCALEVTAAERISTFEERWSYGSVTALMSAYTDLAADQAANDTAAEFARSKVRQKVRDREIAETLCPAYAIGTKRLCLDTGYYEAFNRDNVHLVDLRKTPLVAVSEHGIRTSQREYHFDALVLATGFDAMTGALTSIDIRGRGRQLLADKWLDGPRTYLGLATAGFPNLFIVAGPGSPSVLSNMIVSIEQHVEWISECIRWLRHRGVVTIEAAQQAEDKWVEHVNASANRTLYPRTDSWYLGTNVRGKARVFTPYYGGVDGYRKICDNITAAGYRGFIVAC